jgi:hypothetical protein
MATFPRPAAGSTRPRSRSTVGRARAIRFASMIGWPRQVGRAAAHDRLRDLPASSGQHNVSICRINLGALRPDEDGTRPQVVVGTMTQLT